MPGRTIWPWMACSRCAALIDALRAPFAFCCSSTFARFAARGGYGAQIPAGEPASALPPPTRLGTVGKAEPRKCLTPSLPPPNYPRKHAIIQDQLLPGAGSMQTVPPGRITAAHTARPAEL